MSRRAIHLENSQHDALFDALTQLMRDMAAMAAGPSSDLLWELDLRLGQGYVSHFQFSIGLAGALGCSVVVESQQGFVYEVMRIDAPSTDVPFCFTAKLNSNFK